jgi:DNA-binding response OmpR family regulator
MADAKKLLLIDSDDPRRGSRIKLLVASGYAADIRESYIAAERLGDESSYDLVILALHGFPEKAIAYCDQLKRSTPRLPVLLLTDFGVFVPRGARSRSIESGNPQELIEEIAAMLSRAPFPSPHRRGPFIMLKSIQASCECGSKTRANAALTAAKVRSQSCETSTCAAILPW